MNDHRIDRLDWNDTLHPNHQEEERRKNKERWEARIEAWRDHMRLRNMFWRDQGYPQ